MIRNPKVDARTQDTRFIQVRVARVTTLHPVWSSISRPALGVVPGGIVDVRLGTRPPLYSPGGGCLVDYKRGVLVGLHETSPSRITGEFY
jgi:hypothetical protein